MTLVVPAVRDVESVHYETSGLIFIWGLIGALAAIGSFLVTRGLCPGHQPIGWLQLPMMVAGSIILGIGLFGLVFGAAVLLQISGAFSVAVAMQGFGTAVGIYGGFAPRLPTGALGALAGTLVVGFFALLSGLRAVVRRRGRKALMRKLVAHQAVIHDQGYSVETWERHFEAAGPVVLKYVDAAGRERLITRVLTQYRSSPLANGTVVTMYWDPEQPDNPRKMVFARRLHRRLEYF